MITAIHVYHLVVQKLSSAWKKCHCRPLDSHPNYLQTLFLVWSGGKSSSEVFIKFKVFNFTKLENWSLSRVIKGLFSNEKLVKFDKFSKISVGIRFSSLWPRSSWRRFFKSLNIVFRKEAYKNHPLLGSTNRLDPGPDLLPTLLTWNCLRQFPWDQSSPVLGFEDFRILQDHLRSRPDIPHQQSSTP